MSQWKNELNYYNWTKHRVEKREQIPTGPHFQALVFGTQSVYTPAYDERDRASSHDVPKIDLYVFTKREELDVFVSEAAKSTTSFVFFAVPGLGKATVKVEVDAALPETWGEMGEMNPVR
mgnify:CR=1 FL=1